MKNIRRALLISLGLLFGGARSDFVYKTFHDTTGIIFRGDAVTSSCANASKFAYGDRHSPNQEVFDHITTPNEFSESTTLVQRFEIETNPHGMTNDGHAYIGHRDYFQKEPLKECPVRVRLTPSEPGKRSSMWHLQGIEVASGFECGFRFQITDLSRACNYVKDRNFGLKQYKACNVHGGDGFAFVVQDDTSGTGALGEGGKDMGFGGMRNSLSVAFDTWYNPESGDLFMDHVSVHASGPKGVNAADESTQIGVARPHPLADGELHVARIRYFPEIKYDLIPYFTATTSLLQYIQDFEEGRRMGTLAVFVDNNTVPLLAMPINLNIAMRLREGTAFVGFTASTGNTWEKHDILAWYCCEEPPCLHSETIGMDHHEKHLDERNVDYHQQSRKHAVHTRTVTDDSTAADPSHVER